MFCQKCGMSNPDGATFCTGCGASLPTGTQNFSMGQDMFGGGVPAQQTFPMGGQSKKSSGTAIIIMAVAAILVVAIVVGVLFAFGVLGGGPEKVIRKSLEAAINGDGKTLYEITADPYLIEEALDDGEYDDEEEIKEEFEERALDTQENLEDRYGNDLTYDMEVIRVTEYDDREVEELGEWLAERTDDAYPEDALQDVRVLKVRATIEGDEDKDTETTETVVVKIDGNWYISTIFYSKDQIEDILD